ncbi:hypothetical protein [Bacillus sp. KH172YL63]|uniref:hypothetical protein n=1 Tax=Bacillus sp. KH172YL63 TaxID=2709784 RepID=UPI0013E4A068|nr:hypothetical protein [Bacillus sp. KH172YL63]BCB04309.1 hypothetical protein KH172YL63_24420 [Bacillus sp. KH172YL63]
MKRYSMLHVPKDNRYRERPAVTVHVLPIHQEYMAIGKSLQSNGKASNNNEKLAAYYAYLDTLK